MNTYSPGPWAMDLNIAGGGPHYSFPDLHYINIHSDKYMEVAPEGLSITGYIRKGDAYLITAAPDLLEALQKAADTFRDLRLVLTSLRLPNGAEACAIAEQASRIVIAKAKGQS
jgi:hypothetical protein